MTRAVILSPMGPPAELILPLKISFFSLFGLFWAIFGARGGKNGDHTGLFIRFRLQTPFLLFSDLLLGALHRQLVYKAIYTALRCKFKLKHRSNIKHLHSGHIVKPGNIVERRVSLLAAHLDADVTTQLYVRPFS